MKPLEALKVLEDLRRKATLTGEHNDLVREAVIIINNFIVNTEKAEKENHTKKVVKEAVQKKIEAVK